MEKNEAYKIVDGMVFGTEDSKFLADSVNREIANKYIKSEIERGFGYVYAIAKDKHPKLRDYIENEGAILVNGDFFENFDLSKLILGRFYLRNRNAMTMASGMDGPGGDKIWNASVYSMEMAKEYGPNISSYPGIENALALAVKSIKGISQKENMDADDVIKQYGDRIYKETGKNDWSLGRFGPWHDKSFLFAKYRTTKASFDTLPFLNVDYDYNHRMPEEHSPFHKGDEGQDFIVMIAQDKDPNSKNPYRRVFFDMKKHEWVKKNKPNFMSNEVQDEFMEAIKVYNRAEDYRVFLNKGKRP